MKIMEEETEIIPNSWVGPECSETLSSGHTMSSTHEFITAVVTCMRPEQDEAYQKFQYT